MEVGGRMDDCGALRWNKSDFEIQSDSDAVKVVFFVGHHDEQRNLFSVCIDNVRVSFATTRRNVPFDEADAEAEGHVWYIDKAFHSLPGYFSDDARLSGTRSIKGFSSREMQDAYFSVLVHALQAFSGRLSLPAEEQPPATVVFSAEVQERRERGAYLS